MANGVNVTDKGMQFLVSIDGSEAMSQLRELQSSMKGLASEIEKSVGLTQKTFNKTFDSLGELVKELDKNPGVGIPGAASKDAVKFSQKLNQELEKQRKKLTCLLTPSINLIEKLKIQTKALATWLTLALN